MYLTKNQWCASIISSINCTLLVLLFPSPEKVEGFMRVWLVLFFAAVSTLLLTKCMWILLNEFNKNNEGLMSGVIQQTRYISGAICLAFSSAIAFTNTTTENAILSSSRFALAMYCPFAICLLPLLYAIFKTIEEKRFENATKISLNNWPKINLCRLNSI